MRYVSVPVAILALAVLAACGGLRLPPVATEDVEVFMPGAFPIESYKLLGRLSESMPPHTQDAELIAAVKAKAAEMGADALIIDAIGPQIETERGQEALKVVKARAIYYPSRHPELQQ